MQNTRLDSLEIEASRHIYISALAPPPLASLGKLYLGSVAILLI